jgi:hemerythrin-like domain-containing protein
MRQGWFDRARERHADVQRAVDRLADPARPLADAVDEFLAFAADRLEPLFADEEHELGPLIDRYLPPEVASSARLSREHDTVRELIESLRGVRSQLGASAAAREDAEALVSDLVLLLRDHLRREDSVLHPLLERLDEGRHA